MSKADKEEVARRTDTIARLIMGPGNSSARAIYDWTTRSGWGLTYGQVCRYIQKAQALITREGRKSFDARAEFQKAYARYEMLFAAAMSKTDDKPPDIRTALACLQGQIQLMGLAGAKPEGKKTADAPVSFEIVGNQEDTLEDQAPAPIAPEAPKVTA